MQSVVVQVDSSFNKLCLANILDKAPAECFSIVFPSANLDSPIVR